MPYLEIPGFTKRTLLQVLGLEQYDVAHNKGSSHGESRIIRIAYHEHPDYVPLLQRAWQLWKELEEESQQVILHSLLISFSAQHCLNPHIAD